MHFHALSNFYAIFLAAWGDSLQFSIMAQGATNSSTFYLGNLAPFFGAKPWLISDFALTKAHIAQPKKHPREAHLD